MNYQSVGRQFVSRAAIATCNPSPLIRGLPEESPRHEFHTAPRSMSVASSVAFNVRRRARVLSRQPRALEGLLADGWLGRRQMRLMRVARFLKPRLSIGATKLRQIPAAPPTGKSEMESELN